MKKGKDGVYNRCIKRILDFSLSLCAILLLSPLMLILTAVGAVTMKGNPFFVQRRPGKIDPKTGQPKIFKLIKFRTMSNATDSTGKLLPDGERMNRYGRFLRRTSLDELGELFNILRGDMAIVGPRPLLVEYLPYYTEEEQKRHWVRPGLTGYAQANGRNAVAWDERFQLDVDYVNRVTFFLDIRILWQTVVVVLKHSGLSEDSANEGNFAQIRQAQMAQKG